PASTVLSTLSLHDALPISAFRWLPRLERCCDDPSTVRVMRWATLVVAVLVLAMVTLPRRFVFERFELVRFGNQTELVIGSNSEEDRKSTRLNSSHLGISYA